MTMTMTRLLQAVDCQLFPWSSFYRRKLVQGEELGEGSKPLDCVLWPLTKD